MKKFTLAVVATLMCLSATFSIASAGDATFYISSSHPNTVMIEFYSQSRNAAWPGNGNAYVIRDWKMHTYRLSCKDGEKICYGAWVKGNSQQYWGVGKDDRQSCIKCCIYCNGNTLSRNLSP